MSAARWITLIPPFFGFTSAARVITLIPPLAGRSVFLGVSTFTSVFVSTLFSTCLVTALSEETDCVFSDTSFFGVSCVAFTSASGFFSGTTVLPPTEITRALPTSLSDSTFLPPTTSGRLPVSVSLATFLPLTLVTLLATFSD